MRMSDGDVFVYDPDNGNSDDLRVHLILWMYHQERFGVSTIEMTTRKNLLTEHDEMAKEQQETKVQFVGFVNISLTDDEMKPVDVALAAKVKPDLGEQLAWLLELGKLSFSFNRGSLSCTLTVNEGVSAGYAVSAFSDSPLESVLILRQKVNLYLDKFPVIYKQGGKQKARG